MGCCPERGSLALWSTICAFDKTTGELVWWNDSVLDGTSGGGVGSFAVLLNSAGTEVIEGSRNNTEDGVSYYAAAYNPVSGNLIRKSGLAATPDPATYVIGIAEGDDHYAYNVITPSGSPVFFGEAFSFSKTSGVTDLKLGGILNNYHRKKNIAVYGSEAIALDGDVENVRNFKFYEMDGSSSRTVALGTNRSILRYAQSTTDELAVIAIDGDALADADLILCRFSLATESIIEEVALESQGESPLFTGIMFDASNGYIIVQLDDGPNESIEMFPSDDLSSRSWVLTSGITTSQQHLFASSDGSCYRPGVVGRQLEKYTSGGKQWTTSITGNGVINDMVEDSDGYIYICGEGTFDPNPRKTLFKIDPSDGSVVWSTTNDVAYSDRYDPFGTSAYSLKQLAVGDDYIFAVGERCPMRPGYG